MNNEQICPLALLIKSLNLAKDKKLIIQKNGRIKPTLLGTKFFKRAFTNIFKGLNMQLNKIIDDYVVSEQITVDDIQTD